MAPESEVDRDHELPTVLANRAKAAKNEVAETADLVAATEPLRQVASAARTEIEIIANGAKTARNEVED